jgi:hypothetical protein
MEEKTFNSKEDNIGPITNSFVRELKADLTEKHPSDSRGQHQESSSFDKRTFSREPKSCVTLSSS